MNAQVCYFIKKLNLKNFEVCVGAWKFFLNEFKLNYWNFLLKNFLLKTLVGDSIYVFILIQLGYIKIPLKLNL